MTASIEPAEWLRFTQQEYLGSFIRDGGSAVKFAVPLDEALRPGLFHGLSDAASQSGYLLATIDSAETKVQMVDELFFRTAAQIPWRVLCQKVIAKLAAETGYSPVDPGDAPFFRTLAEENHVDPQMLLLDLKQVIWTRVFKQGNLSADFRTAMTHLCLAELSGGAEGETTVRALTDWLTGRNKATGPIKPYQLLHRIHRANARYFFESMVHWVRFAGYAGTVILLDAQRVMLARNPHDQGIFYSKAAVLDTYEVLRQFIDRADQLEGCFFAVIPDLTFLEDHSRGIGAYEALKFRIFDEIRDRNLANPMASLARIALPAQGN